MIMMMLPSFAAFVLCAVGYTVEVVYPRRDNDADRVEPHFIPLLVHADVISNSDGVILAA